MSLQDLQHGTQATVTRVNDKQIVCWWRPYRDWSSLLRGAPSDSNTIRNPRANEKKLDQRSHSDLRTVLATQRLNTRKGDDPSSIGRYVPSKFFTEISNLIGRLSSNSQNNRDSDSVTSTPTSIPTLIERFSCNLSTTPCSHSNAFEPLKRLCTRRINSNPNRFERNERQRKVQTKEKGKRKWNERESLYSLRDVHHVPLSCREMTRKK